MVAAVAALLEGYYDEQRCRSGYQTYVIFIVHQFLPIIGLFNYLLEGVRAGLLLALLVGPLVILLIQLSLRRGTAAALAAAFGIWLSDLSFILLTHYGIGELTEIVELPAFTQLVGTAGCLILVVIAIVMWFRPPPDLTEQRKMPSRKGLFASALQGFAINTFNPFTLTFWSVFALTQVHERELTEQNAWAVYGGILLTIVVTDTIKVLMALKLRGWLRPEIVLRVQRLGALALAVFGVVLGVRVWW